MLLELLDRNVISKWNAEDSTEAVLLKADECASNNGTKATPALSAEFLLRRRNVATTTPPNQIASTDYADS